MRRRASILVAAFVTILAVALGADGAVERAGAAAARTPTLNWHGCEGGFQCAIAEVPRDYSAPWKGTLKLELTRRQATEATGRVGSVFLNPGGPGASGVALVQGSAEKFAALNRHFDLVGFDPRGVGRSDPSVRCLSDDEATAQFSAPFVRPETLDVAALRGWAAGWVDRCVARNRGILPYLSTANVARDLDLLRAAVGDPKLTYLGFSYGTLLGATYASLFPRRVRALALDGPVDADLWMNRPLQATREQVAAFERELGRFFAACARGTVCTSPGADPQAAFDRLVKQLDEHPISAGSMSDSRPVTGDTLLVATARAMDTRSRWAILAGAIARAQRGGDAPLLRSFADAYWGINDKGSYDAVWDRNFVISALDQRNPDRIGAYLTAGRDANALFPYFWWSSGYSELPWGLFSIRPRGVFRGPFTMPADATPALVVGTTYDPSTPYAWARRLTRQLGNARLLTMVGDGHTAFFSSSCVQKAVSAYLDTLGLPPADTECAQMLDSAISSAARRRRAGARHQPVSSSYGTQGPSSARPLRAS